MKSAGNPATRRRSTESAGTPATWRRPRKSAGNSAIRRRSTTREPEGTTKIERDRRAIDPGLNDAIDEVDNSRQYLRSAEKIEDEVIQRVIDPTLILRS